MASRQSSEFSVPSHAETKPTRRTKRRGNGEGSIYQRPNGIWVATISLGRDGSGKRLRRTIYGSTKREVQDELAKLHASKGAGTLTTPSRTTLTQFLTHWLENVARVTVRATTYYNYKSIVDNHISPRIGGLGLQKLLPAHVQGLYSEMERAKIGPHARRLAHAVLRRALKYALKQGIVVRNVCDAVEPPRISRRDVKSLDEKQVGALLAAVAGDRLEALYWVAVGGGLRIGELFGLQWADVDIKAGTVAVRRTLTEVNGKLALAEPKSSKGQRLVTLPPAAIEALIEHRKRMMAAGFAGAPSIFCNQSGGYLRRSHFHAESFKPLLKLAGLPNIRFHDLRHTSASLLLKQGVHPKVVQERLGHSQISITLDTYSHVLPGMQKDAADKLGAMMIPAALENGNIVATFAS